MSKQRGSKAKKAAEKAAEVRRLRGRIDAAREAQLLEIRAFANGAGYAQTRYFELELDITNRRILRLEAPPSFADMVLWVFIGGAAGPLAQVLTQVALRRLLASRLLFVQNFTAVRMNEVDAQRVREFFRLGEATGPFDFPTIEEKFLNENSWTGRVYRFLPDYIGTRLDEIVQNRPDYEPKFWPETTSRAAEAFLAVSNWADIQERSVRLEYAFYESLLDEGDVARVKRIADGLEQASAEPLTPEQEQALLQRSRLVGEGLLLILMSERYGPAKKLADVRRASSPTKPLATGGYESRYVREYQGGGAEIVQALVRGLINPETDPPMTFFEWAKNRLPENYRSRVDTDTHFENRAVDDAAVELMRRIDMTLLEVRRNPSPFKSLLPSDRSR